MAYRLGVDVGGLSVSLSSEILPEMREYERTITTVANSYVRPTVARYLSSLRSELKSRGVGALLKLLRSDGGLMSFEAAEEAPVNMLLTRGFPCSLRHTSVEVPPISCVSTPIEKSGADASMKPDSGRPSRRTLRASFTRGAELGASARWDLSWAGLLRETGIIRAKGDASAATSGAAPLNSHAVARI